jgi:hypothetical protein
LALNRNVLSGVRTADEEGLSWQRRKIRMMIEDSKRRNFPGKMGFEEWA